MSINDIPLGRLKDILASDMPLTIVTTEALITRLEQAEAAVVRVEKLLADSEEIEAMMPDQYDRIWISSVRRALDGEQS